MHSSSWARRFMCAVLLCSPMEYQRADGINTTPHPKDCTYNDLNGRKFNLTTISRSDGNARFEASDIPSDPEIGYEYSFNPCIPFKLGDCQSDVAICRSHGESYKTVGKQKSAQFGSYKNYPALHYSSGDQWKSTVVLKCDFNEEGGIFRVWEDYQAAKIVLNLTHKCACPNACLVDPSDPATKEPTTASSDQTDTIVAEVVPSVTGGGILITVVIFILLWFRKRRNDEYPPLVGDNRDAAVKVHQNEFPYTSEGSELTSGRGSASFRSLTKPTSTGSSCSDITVPNKKDELKNKVNSYEEDLC